MPTAAPSPRSRPVRSRSAPVSPLKSTRGSSIIKVKLFFTPLPSSFRYASFLPCRRLRLFRWRHPPLSPHVAPARRRRRAFSVEHLRRQCPRLPAHRPTERRALAHCAAPDTLRLFLTVGLCGGFTTFSTFVADGRALWQQQLTFTAVAYLCSSLIVGFALLGLGHRLAA